MGRVKLFQMILDGGEMKQLVIFAEQDAAGDFDTGESIVLHLFHQDLEMIVTGAKPDVL